MRPIAVMPKEQRSFIVRRPRNVGWSFAALTLQTPKISHRAGAVKVLIVAWGKSFADILLPKRDFKRVPRRMLSIQAFMLTNLDTIKPQTSTSKRRIQLLQKPAGAHVRIWNLPEPSWYRV